MSNGTLVYEVHEAANGYFAKLSSGKVVVGKTLAEVTAEANAVVTEEMTAIERGTTPDPDVKGWQKGLMTMVENLANMREEIAYRVLKNGFKKE